MTNAAASIALTFAGVDVQHDDFGIFLEITQGLNEGPEVRGQDFVIPSVVGRTATNRKADRRRILLSGIVRGNGTTHADQQADYRDMVETFQALFSPASDPAELAATLENGSVKTINARVLNVAWNEAIQSLFAFVSVEMESVDPEWTAAGS